MLRLSVSIVAFGVLLCGASTLSAQALSTEAWSTYKKERAQLASRLAAEKPPFNDAKERTVPGLLAQARRRFEASPDGVSSLPFYSLAAHEAMKSGLLFVVRSIDEEVRMADFSGQDRWRIFADTWQHRADRGWKVPLAKGALLQQKNGGIDTCSLALFEFHMQRCLAAARAGEKAAAKKSFGAMRGAVSRAKNLSKESRRVLLASRQGRRKQLEKLGVQLSSERAGKAVAFEAKAALVSYAQGKTTEWVKILAGKGKKRHDEHLLLPRGSVEVRVTKASLEKRGLSGPDAVVLVSGWVTPRATGSYVVRYQANHGCFVLLNGVWLGGPPEGRQWRTDQVFLEADRPYLLQVAFKKNPKKPAVMQLEWHQGRVGSSRRIPLVLRLDPGQIARLPKDERRMLRQVKGAGAGESGPAKAKAGLDDSRVVRRIARQPEFVARPRYALFVFGNQCEARMWAVLDKSDRKLAYYDVLYLDKNCNGDLTEPGERVTAKFDKRGAAAGTSITLQIPELPIPGTKLVHKKFKVCTVSKKDRKGIWFQLLWNGVHEMSGGYGPTGFNNTNWTHDPETAPILRPNPRGPLTFGLFGGVNATIGGETKVFIMAGRQGSGPNTLSVVDEHFLKLDKEELIVTVIAKDETGQEVRTSTRIKEHC